MIVYFGLEFDATVYPKPQNGEYFVGSKGLLHLLETWCGLSGHPNNDQHLRIEQYRQAAIAYANENPTVFYKASLDADQLGTADTLLFMRDELRIAGWDFKLEKGQPKRLAVLAEIETYFQDDTGEIKLRLSPGYADRYRTLIDFIPKIELPFTQFFHNERLDLLPTHLQTLIAVLEAKGISCQAVPHPTNEGNNDLNLLQKILDRRSIGSGQVDLFAKAKTTLKGDGSLVILNAKRDTDAAAFVAKLIQANADLQPLCLIPEQSRVLDNAFIQEGLPSLGILSASLARPTLQILKLVPAFLWDPIDPFKVLEFVSLALKPLEDYLAANIAVQMAQTPGIKGEGWNIMLAQYFDALNKRAERDSSIDVDQIRQQYNFWFERERVGPNQKVAKEKVIDIFEHISNWAQQVYSDSKDKNNNLLVLKEQAKRIKDLLEALPKNETHLSNLELERIVRTIYQPAPVSFKEKQSGHLPFIHHTSALIEPVDDLLWWNFARNEYEHFFSRWYHHETDYLAKGNIQLSSPTHKNNILLWQRPRPVFFAKKRLILVIPQMVNGAEVHTHPIMDEIEATLEGIQACSYDIHSQEGKAFLEKYFKIPDLAQLDHNPLGRPQPFLQVKKVERLAQREEETLTSLDTLFYYPYQWVFRHKIKLRTSSILSVVGDNTLMGNLAHKFFEKMLKEADVIKWTKADIFNWIDKESTKLLAREGVVLLLYGREPDRVAFINKVKFAALSLITAIQKNNWTVRSTEEKLSGTFLDLPVKGKADIVLERGHETVIVDLKWRGASWRSKMIKNEEDLQLVMYAQLLGEKEDWCHTSYFIIENGKFIARNNQAFSEAEEVAPDADHKQVAQEIWKSMERTYQWRRAQLDKGQIEVRTPHTIPDLELTYGDELMHVLEMKNSEAYFDDYRVLINLVD